MSVMFYDIHEALDRKPAGLSYNSWNMWELPYADDTLLVGTRAREINLLVSEIETVLEKYSLKLNYAKCNYVATNGKRRLTSEMAK